MNFKTQHQQKIELRNGPKKLSRRPGSKQITSPKNFTHTVCQKMLLEVSIDHSGMVSHSATFIDLSHPTFCINSTKEFSSIWSIGARESSLLRNWTSVFEHFLLPMVLGSSKWYFRHVSNIGYRKEEHGKDSPWLPCWVYACTGN